MLGAPFGVGYYIWKSVIPVTLGNLVGGALFVGFPIWYLYLAGPSPWHSGGRKIEPGMSEGGPSGAGVTKGPGHEGESYDLGDPAGYRTNGHTSDSDAFGRPSEAGTLNTMDGRTPLVSARHPQRPGENNVTRRVSARNIV
jgi:hypothetical protein